MSVRAVLICFLAGAFAWTGCTTDDPDVAVAASGSGAAGGNDAGSGGSGAGVSVGGSGSGGSDCSFEGKPYGHAEPGHVGICLGVGVVALAPTDAYAGPTSITSPTTIENVVIDGCLSIESDDVTVRNVVINCNGLYPIRIDAANDVTVEYSQINCTSSTKTFLVADSQRLTVRNNEATGCEDIFFIEGAVDGLDVAYNYFHDLMLSPQSHADGFQIGEFDVTTGSIAIHGNYFDPNSDGGKTDILFATGNAQAAITMENNFFKIWGLKTLRCGGTSTCSVNNNVYEQAFENLDYPDSSGSKLLFVTVTSPQPATAMCNRLEDGSLPEEVVDGVDRFDGVDHVITGCPALP